MGVQPDLVREQSVKLFNHQVGSNPTAPTNKCGFSYIHLYLYMSDYDCSSFGQLDDCIGINRYNIINNGYSLLGMDDKVYQKKIKVL